ncbi:MAG TPA: hypothetical protein GXZ64_04190 [Clostridiaceae bacterium]|nr:hypothetical protein [Clostridiaceae bacterium]
MRSRKRPNLGLILFTLLLAAAVFYTAITEERQQRRLDTGMATIRRLFEQETAAIIFSDQAIEDGTIDDEELSAAKAGLKQVLDALYSDNPNMKEARLSHLTEALEMQADAGYFLRALAPDWDMDPALTEEDGLLKLETAFISLSADFFAHGSAESMSGYYLRPGVSFLFQEADSALVVIDQADAVGSRLLALELGNADGERDLPWKPF